MVSRFVSGDPERRVRLLQRLGDDVARRHLDVVAVDAGEGRLDHHPRDDRDRLGPLGARGRPVDTEARELSARRALPRAELDAPVRDEVERRGSLGDPCRVLVAGRQRQDAEAQPDVLGPLGCGGEEDAGCTGVGVLLQEVVLGGPDGVVAEAVGELDLSQRLLQEAVLGARVPGPGKLVLVEQREAHVEEPTGRTTTARN